MCALTEKVKFCRYVCTENWGCGGWGCSRGARGGMREIESINERGREHVQGAEGERTRTHDKRVIK